MRCKRKAAEPCCCALLLLPIAAVGPEPYSGVAKWGVPYEYCEKEDLDAGVVTGSGVNMRGVMTVGKAV